ncbi:hypothetical protein EON65_49695 [archaeon]|nr:MAG: hypothetical protein EON65_49695 [archaeon]
MCSTVGKRSRSVVARCSPKKRRVGADTRTSHDEDLLSEISRLADPNPNPNPHPNPSPATTASYDEELLSYLSRLANHYAPVCNPWLTTQLREFLNIVTGRAGHC